MNLIVVGASYRTAPVELLEQLSRVDGPQALPKLLSGGELAEAVVVSTCNRVEVYAAVPAFHAGLSRLGEVLSELSGVPAEQLANTLYVHHGQDAVRHVFRVAAGLDSMVAGEAQILGQLREAYQQSTEADATGKVLHELLQQALRVGKRAHAETGIDHAPRSMVSAALDHAVTAADGDWLVVGAGAMGALSVAELTRRGAGTVTVLNRGLDRAQRLADAYGCAAAPMDRLPELLATADVVITATASAEHVLTVENVGAARAGSPKILTIIDLALPRDVEPAVAALDGVRLVDVARLGTVLDPGAAGAPVCRRSAADREVAAVEEIVAGEVETYASWLRGAEVAPTVAALRARAEDVVSAELRRLAQRRSDLTDEQRADVAHTVHRIVQRLLHQPTVRVRQLAAEPGGEAYARLLRDLFDLSVIPGSPDHTTVADVPDLKGGA
ncbi:glutamyl-tRNA reductase [Catellatospora bangladeshensis]|uniref:Glutamyl-tRNA reductase n=1 Tax=Catellatospora bangladeshensis TaxID=310355 RepID=A0A8J3J7B6_9ACTN|nr:glutamyl-tRNA reductase [Catellatospora bangladeshensis]GIF79472.1 glutamyl-tRNA reductase [Catellatospora bangladeshensis]